MSLNLQMPNDGPCFITWENRFDQGIRPQSFNREAMTIDAVVASGTPVKRRDQRGEFMEILDVSGADLTALRGASVLDSHMQSGLTNVLGNVERAWIEGNQILATIRFSSRAEVAPTIEDIANGVIRHLSVGYEIGQWAEGTDTNGMRTKTATSWSPREVSFVAVPADPRAVTRTRAADQTADVTADRAAINRSIRELGTRANVASEIINDLVDRGATLDEVRSTILSDLMDRGAQNIRSTSHQTVEDPQFRIKAQAEGLLTRIDPKFKPSSAGRQYVGMTLSGHAQECMRRAGISTTGLSPAELVTRALNTTSDYPAVLLDVINKTLRDTYTAAPSGLKEVARETTNQDFRTKYRVQLDSLGMTLDPVTESGEFTYGSMIDAKESYSIDSFGKIFGISRKALVNDDLGAFSSISRRLGQTAASFENQFLVNLLTSNSNVGPTMDDGLALFHATHKNLSGTGAAPSDTTLNAARLALRKQTSPGGGLINATPYAVIVPPDLETATQKVLAAIQATAVTDVNVWTFLRLIVEPRLTNTTAWYLVADPAQIDGLEYAYLAGSPGPQVESRVGFEVDGLEVKCREDFGAGFVDFRGWYKNPGV